MDDPKDPGWEWQIQDSTDRARSFGTYESTTDEDHKAKVAQVSEGEIPVFNKAGFWPVFFGDTFIGSRLPSLTYMVGFVDNSILAPAAYPQI
jgi:hypothetical protein